MITIDKTEGNIPKYEVVICTRDLTVRVLYHYYQHARLLFTDLATQHLSGVSVYLNDLTILSDC